MFGLLGSARAVPFVLLVAAPFVVYSNNYRHAYHLDDAYTVVTNPSIRKLALIPRYFVDPATYTSVREQAEYRPILQTTYALNYAWTRYSTWSWHLVQILLHVVVTLGLFAFARRVLQIAGDENPDRSAFIASLIFAVHPAASGVVNYFNARSSLLTAAFLVPALLRYLQPIEDERYVRPRWDTAALLALALFTKVEAIGGLGALWALELWQRGREIPGTPFLLAVRRAFDRRTLIRIAPSLAVTAAYVVIRARVMAPFPFDESRKSPDVGASEYFATQLTAWWHYVARYVAPIHLVSDNLAYPVYRSWLDPVVLLAAAGWLLVAAILIGTWRRAPHLAALAIAALAILSPTSSIAPLAEMVNEHRPYLPMGILALVAIFPAAQLLRRWHSGIGRVTVFAAGAVALVAFATLTWQRNLVFRSDVSYWKDVLDKAPSSRAHLNYGLAMMTAGNVEEGLKHYQRTLELAPFWYFTHLNLGAAYQRLGHLEKARYHFDKAVEYDRYSGHALTWRGEFFLAQGSFAAARDDFERSLTLSTSRYRNAKGLAAAYAGLGDSARSQTFASEMLAIDSATASRDLASARMAATQTGSVTTSATLAEQQALMARGLDSLRALRYAAAEGIFRRVLALNATHYGAHYQLAIALDHQGRRAEARPIWQRVLRMAESYNDATTIRAAQLRLQERQ